MKKVLWKVATCLAVVLMSLSVYSCGDDDEDSVGSREMLLGKWTGVYYLDQEWEDGEMVHNNKEDFVNGTTRYSIEFREDGTYVEIDGNNNENHNYGTWSYSGNKLTMIDTSDGDYKEVWTVTTMTETELVYELREKEKEDGVAYEYYQQHAFKR